MIRCEPSYNIWLPVPAINRIPVLLLAKLGPVVESFGLAPRYRGFIVSTHLCLYFSVYGFGRCQHGKDCYG